MAKGLRESNEAKRLLEQRDVLALRSSGWSWEDVAERLGITVPTAKQRYKRALALIRPEVADLAMATFMTDLQLYAGAIEGLKSRVASGEPIATKQMLEIMEARHKLFGTPAEDGGAAAGTTKPRTRINFVRDGDERPGHEATRDGADDDAPEADA